MAKTKKTKAKAKATPDLGTVGKGGTGAAAGAATGAAIGSMLGPLGAAAGAVLGGVVGMQATAATKTVKGAEAKQRPAARAGMKRAVAKPGTARRPAKPAASTSCLVIEIVFFIGRLPGFHDRLRLLGFELDIGDRRQLLHVDLLRRERIEQFDAGPRNQFVDEAAM